MLLNTPSVNLAAPQTGTQVGVFAASFDLAAHRYTIVYGLPGGGPNAQRVVSGPIPGALQTAIEAHAQSAIEADLGIVGQSTIGTP